MKEGFFISNLTLNFEYPFDKNQIKVTKKNENIALQQGAISE